MGRVVIANANETSPTAFPSLAGVSVSGQVETKPVIAASDRPLLLWQHALAPGAEIRWNAPPVGHLVYTWHGAAETNGGRLNEDGALVVEQGASAAVRAGSAPVTLLHFYRPVDTSPARAGGHVHIINRADAQYYKIAETEGTVWADSSCPTCEFWFHKNEFDHPLTAGRHLHTEDEIIFVVRGHMKVGNRRLQPGTALAIDANTVYTFTVEVEGLAFINFRAQEPNVVMVTPEGKSAPLREYEFVRDAVANTRRSQAASAPAA